MTVIDVTPHDPIIQAHEHALRAGTRTRCESCQKPGSLVRLDFGDVPPFELCLTCAASVAHCSLTTPTIVASCTCGIEIATCTPSQPGAVEAMKAAFVRHVLGI